MDTAQQISQAVKMLKAGGVIAYPTEHCFGLGCDPQNKTAVERLLKIKQRKADQGLILVAADLYQVDAYVEFSGSALISTEQKKLIRESWPGANTWLLPVTSDASKEVTQWVRGKHQSVAMRVSAHQVCMALCREFSGAVVSTSANRHGQPAHLNAADVAMDMKSELDYIIDAPVGGDSRPSTIRDGITADLIR